MRIVLLLLLSLSLPSWAAAARIGVASNFTATAERLISQYTQQSGHHITLSSASTGKLYAQIRQGAPFDILLAADSQTPRQLLAQGLAVPGSQFDYAQGRLILWRAKPGPVGLATLQGGQFNKLAIANPKHAPYGMAAKALLQKQGLWEGVQGKLVLGENVAQAAQFVASGAADLALLSKAQRPRSGAVWDVPAHLHPNMIQTAVLLKQAGNNPAALGFMRYLRSPAARQMIVEAGYD